MQPILLSILCQKIIHVIYTCKTHSNFVSNKIEKKKILIEAHNKAINIMLKTDIYTCNIYLQKPIQT